MKKEYKFEMTATEFIVGCIVGIIGWYYTCKNITIFVIRFTRWFKRLVKSTTIIVNNCKKNVLEQKKN